MTATGYTDQRAATHDKVALPDFCTNLYWRGYIGDDLRCHDRLEIQTLDPDIHRPDLRFRWRGGDWIYVDLKTREPGSPNLSIKAEQYDEQLERWPGTLHAWKLENDIWRIGRHDWIELQRQRTPDGAPVIRKPTGRGSDTWWFLVYRPETAPPFPFGLPGDLTGF